MLPSAACRLPVVALVLVLVAGCGDRTITLNSEDNGRTVQVDSGTVFRVEFLGGGSLPDRWMLVDSGGGVVVPVGPMVPVVRGYNPNTVPTGRSYQTWTLRAERAGQATLRFEMRTPNLLPTDPPHQTIAFRLRVEEPR